MQNLRIALAAVAILAVPAAVRADTYSFTISTAASSMGSPATSFVASGTLTGNSTTVTPPTLALTGVTGSAQGYAFSGIAPLGLSTGFIYDNFLFTSPTATHVDANGILLYLTSSAGTSLAHVYNNAGYHVDVFDPKDTGDVTPFAIDAFTLTPSAVPEPSTLALIGTGALGLFGAVRRKLVR